MSSFDNLYRYKAVRVFGVIFANRSNHCFAVEEACAVFGERAVEDAIDRHGEAAFGFIFQERHDYSGNRYDPLCAMDIKPVWYDLHQSYRPGDGDYPSNTPEGAWTYNEKADELPAFNMGA